MPNNKRKIINDPVFGFITIPSDLIYDLLQHSYLLRLTRIKQLGLTSYVYPGTQHTRFQHSLGALYLMTEAVSTLRSKGVEITDDEADAVYAAILLHDVGHGPFSHTLENCFFPNISHEELTIKICELLNEEMDGALNSTLDVLQDNHKKKFLREMVSGQLDMDRLDFIRRDSFFSGVSEGNIGSARIIKMLNIKDNKLVVEAKGIYSIENFLMSRRLMYWQVYFHKTAYAAEKMIINTIRRAKYIQKSGTKLFAPPALQYFLDNQNPELNRSSLTNFLSLDDSDIWTSMKVWISQPDKVLSTLCDGIVNRKLFKMDIGNKKIDDSKIHMIKSEIANRLNISLEDAEYLTSSASVSQHIYKGDETNIGILYNNGNVKTIQEASDMFDINVLSRKITKYYFCYYRY
ncbi:MAG: HD domain protein [Bacteroidetes bacterium ADurb.Bin302]|nr:MAG: HD domain protein [Bacteroidetes bacterium ADurb.Bin302]HPG55179.1 HD domain-containing protein [Candidatus Enterocola sp.]